MSKLSISHADESYLNAASQRRFARLDGRFRDFRKGALRACALARLRGASPVRDLFVK
jgi:hypothetical protein